MEGIEKITRQILSEAKAECDAVNKQMRARVAEIEAQFDKKAEEIYSAAMQEGKAAAEADAKHIERNARLSARKDILAVKQELVDKAFAMAGEKLRTMPDDKYSAWICALIAEAADGDEKIVLDATENAGAADILAKANALLAAKGKKAELTLADENAEIGAGFILRKGDIEVNCTAEEMLASARKELAADVASKLFG